MPPWQVPSNVNENALARLLLVKNNKVNTFRDFFNFN